MVTKLELLVSSEDEYVSLLTQMQRLLEPRQMNGTTTNTSSCDPLNRLLRESATLSATCRKLLQKHAGLAQQRLYSGLDFSRVLTSWLEDNELQQLYSTLLEKSTTLIFETNKAILLQRFSPVSELTRLLLAVSRRLQEMASSCMSPNDKVLAMTRLFEERFLTQWNRMDCNSFRYDDVKPLLSQFQGPISAPLVDAANSRQRGYFKLTLPKFGYHDHLVELLQLRTGELGIYTVTSGHLSPMSVDQIAHLVLVSQNFKSVQLGRSLLFPVLRPSDLKIISVSRNSIELEAKTDNGVKLTLVALDSSQWNNSWKSYLNMMFSEGSHEAILPSEQQTSSSLPLTRSTHYLEILKAKHDKLSALRPDDVAGLGFSIKDTPSQPSKVVDSRNVSQLHKSKPLDGSLMSPVSSLHALEDLDDLGCESLLQLDHDINMPESPVSHFEQSFSAQNFKRVDSGSSVSREEVSSGEYAEDGESIVSSVDDGKDEEAFDLSTEFYRPQLTRRKSSSLLSIFSSNKAKSSSKLSKSLALELPSGNSTASLLKVPRVQSPANETSTTSQQDEYCVLPAEINVNEGFQICDHNVKVSHWYANSWKLLSFQSLSFKLHETTEGKVVCMLCSTKDNRKLKICAFVTPDWKVTRPAAQDVQLRIPSTSFLASTLPNGPSVISLRCQQIDKLMNTLHHCIRQNLPSRIRASNTSGTLSTTSSTFSAMDKSVSRSDTTSTGLSSIAQDIFSRYKEETISLLLLSNVKVRLHHRNGQAGWEIKDKGLLGLYSQELRGHIIGMKFDIIMGSAKKQEYVSKMGDIKRIGRTGISLVHDDSDYLVEFRNQIVANEVFKLISCLI
ncbi:LAFA_0G03906g1_1 [Lachancea sp. 'fantastica']|nr:LAFA_0G03906g1_1 [Lachancea sp. 'fantastica']